MRTYQTLLTTLLLLLFISSCQKDESLIQVPDDPGLETDDFNGSADIRGEKRNVCHNGKIKRVNINAVAAHQGHGDAVDMDDDGYFDQENVCSSGVDCDDNDPNVNPGATELLCNGIDDDCDPNTSEEMALFIDPDGTPGNGDEYVLYVFPNDNSPGIEWSSLSVTDATSTWEGDENTTTIIEAIGSGDYAAKVCASLTAGGCDWYLPANGELNAMYQQLGPSNNGYGGSGDMPNGVYWSSTEENFVASNAQDFSNGDLLQDIKFNNLRCRCVRR